MDASSGDIVKSEYKFSALTLATARCVLKLRTS